MCRDEHLITNILCVICIGMLLGAIIAAKFAVKFGIDWLQTHRNSSVSKWVDGHIGASGASLQSMNGHNVFSLKNNERIVHLDLKGAPPKLDYFLEVIPFISKLGRQTFLLIIV